MKNQQEQIDETILLKVLDNTAVDKERIIFTKWIEASSENAESFELLKKTYQLTSIDTQSNQKNWEAIVRKVKEGVEVPDYIELPDPPSISIFPNMNRLIRMAALFILLLSVSYLVKITVLNPEQLIISSKDIKPNEPYQLADGSKLYLNENSEISISKKFGKKNRTLLLKGVAFFEVQRNEDIPFIITTYKTTIRVLGTSFNVYSDKTEQVRVSVVSGVVEFSTDENKYLEKLEAGDQGIYNPSLKSIEKKTINDPNFMAWKTGILYFDDTPVPEAFRLLQKQYSRILIFEEKQEDRTTLTTTFDNQSLVSVLEELDLLLNAKHEIRNDTIFFQSSNL